MADTQDSLRQAKAARDRGDDEAALEVLEAALAESPGVPAILSELGALLCDLGDLQRANKIYRQLLVTGNFDDDAPGKAELLQKLGDLYHTLGELAKAKQLYARAGELDPARGQPGRELKARPVENSGFEPGYTVEDDSSDEPSGKLPVNATIPFLAAFVLMTVFGLGFIGWGMSNIFEWNSALDRLDAETMAEVTHHRTRGGGGNSIDYQIRYAFRPEPEGETYRNSHPDNPFGSDWVELNGSDYESITKAGQVSVRYVSSDPNVSQTPSSIKAAPGWVGVIFGAAFAIAGFIVCLVGIRLRRKHLLFFWSSAHEDSIKQSEAVFDPKKP